MPSNFTWTNSDALASVNRQGATVTWTGGGTAAYVEIVGGGGTGDDTTTPVYFICRAPTSPGQFTIPSYALMAIPPGSGNLSVAAVSSQQSFSAPGLDFGSMRGEVRIERSVRF